MKRVARWRDYCGAKAADLANEFIAVSLNVVLFEKLGGGVGLTCLETKAAVCKFPDRLSGQSLSFGHRNNFRDSRQRPGIIHEWNMRSSIKRKGRCFGSELRGSLRDPYPSVRQFLTCEKRLFQAVFESRVPLKLSYR